MLYFDEMKLIFTFHTDVLGAIYVANKVSYVVWNTISEDRKCIVTLIKFLRSDYAYK
jgi:hypothetical protein